MTRVDVYYHPEGDNYPRSSFSDVITSTKATPKHRVGDYVRNADEPNFISKRYTSIWKKELFKDYPVPKMQPPENRIQNNNGEIKEGKI